VGVDARESSVHDDDANVRAARGAPGGDVLRPGVGAPGVLLDLLEAERVALAPLRAQTALDVALIATAGSWLPPLNRKLTRIVIQTGLR